MSGELLNKILVKLDTMNNSIVELKRGQDDINKEIAELKHGQEVIIKQLGKTMEDVSAIRNEIDELAAGIEFLTHKTAQQERDIFILKRRA